MEKVNRRSDNSEDYLVSLLIFWSFRVERIPDALQSVRFASHDLVFPFLNGVCFCFESRRKSVTEEFNMEV